MTDCTRKIQRLDDLLRQLDRVREDIEARRRRLIALQRAAERNSRHMAAVLDRLDRGETVARRGAQAQWLDADGRLLGRPTADDWQALRTLGRGGVVREDTYTNGEQTNGSD